MPDAMEALLAHAWPGNVRELEHVIERAVLLAAGDELHAADLHLGTRSDAAATLDGMTLDEAEHILIQRALARHPDVDQAARALGLSRSAFYRRLAHHGLKRNG
jgi:transcriptional regulator of acetoin/glycerol metabolism